MMYDIMSRSMPEVTVLWTLPLSGPRSYGPVPMELGPYGHVYYKGPQDHTPQVPQVLWTGPEVV